MKTASGTLLLRNAKRLGAGDDLVDVAVAGGRVAAVEPAGGASAAPGSVDLAGRTLLPGMINAHDHLDGSTLPALTGGAVYRNAQEWLAALARRQSEPDVMRAMAVPLADRLLLGGLRNLLAGVTAVAHHGTFHRSLAREDFPVRVLERYQFASSAATTAALRKTYRTTDRRIPWFVHAAEGTDARAAEDLGRLAAENVLRQNTVIIHGIALPETTLRAVAAARACVVWSPEANRRVYGATADVRALSAAGVRVGLGAESPVCGGRDPLSNLAAARREDVLSDADLLALATAGSAEVARLPAGGLVPGAVADLIAVDSTAGLLEGRRAAIVLVLVGGEPRYGEDDIMSTIEPRSVPLSVDGAPRRLHPAIGEHAMAALCRQRAAVRPEWMEGVEPRTAAE